jgi:hypothetical protein
MTSPVLWSSAWPEVDPRVPELAASIGMPFSEVPVGTEFGEIPRLYLYGSQPDYQVWDGKKLCFDPSSTDGFDLLHEVAHHIECMARRPESLGMRNWGILPSDDVDGDVPEVPDDVAEQESCIALEREMVACFIEVAFHLLWNTGHWAARGDYLNLFDGSFGVHPAPDGRDQQMELVLRIALPLMRDAGVPSHLMEES